MASNTKDTTFFNSKTRLFVIFPYLILSNIHSNLDLRAINLRVYLNLRADSELAKGIFTK